MVELARREHVERVAIQTNLSASLDWLDAVDPATGERPRAERIGLWATYHPGWAEPEPFIARVCSAARRGVSISVGVVGMREHFEAIADLRRALPDDIYLWVNAFKRVPGYYSAAEVEGLRAELAAMEQAIDVARRDATDAIAAYRLAYPGQLRFAYETPTYDDPFFIRAIWHDGEFTYIKTDAQELPALYETKDGKPALVNFQVQGDTYVVRKVIDRGYLVLGRERVEFEREG